MSTAIVWLTRDLRVHDHPALRAGTDEADHVVPVFVMDEAILADTDAYANANKRAHLHAALTDLTSAMRDLGGALVKREGKVPQVLAQLVEEVGADVVHTTADVSGYASRRLEAVRDALDVEVVTHPGHLVHHPGTITTTSGGAYRVYTPYRRAWAAKERRDVLGPPDAISLPSGVEVGRTPSRDDLLRGTSPSPDLRPGGEQAARADAARWLDGAVDGYDDQRDDLADDATSRLSAHLHLGTISANELADRADQRNPGADAFVRQLAWRDFHHQVLAEDTDRAHTDVRDQGDDWDHDEDLLEAWRTGHTGVPVVDAAMRQLLDEGFMHNRARMVVASFLTRELYQDWREGAAHFMAWLADGDVANNQLNWQWVAGTGTVSRPNRRFNPVTQGERHDPSGDYVRRYVPELRDVEGKAVHRPWDLDDDVRADLDYPDPVVDLDTALDRFRAARGID